MCVSGKAREQNLLSDSPGELYTHRGPGPNPGDPGSGKSQVMKNGVEVVTNLTDRPRSLEQVMECPSHRKAVMCRPSVCAL